MGSSLNMAHFRFTVVGQLLSIRQRHGDLKKAIEELSKKTWRNPSGNNVTLGFSTIESWYYKVLKKDAVISPVDLLVPQKRSDYNLGKIMTIQVRELLNEQIKINPSWNMQLHADNLASILRDQRIEPIPSYTTIKKYMRRIGYKRQFLIKDKNKGRQKSIAIKSHFEQCSYEHGAIGTLFHLDFHHCSREIILSSGEIVKPKLFGVIDDCSRLICHLQWYLGETTENLVHGFIQTILKRGIPRNLMTDCGSAMKSNEFQAGLKALGIIFNPTLTYSPEQNGKIESFWCQIENRLMPLIGNKKNINLKELNEYTQAWVEIEYNRKYHSSIKETPYERFTSKENMTRRSESPDLVKNYFRKTENRKVRNSDGTISVGGLRFEIPSCFRHLRNITVQYADWDLSNVSLIERESMKILGSIYPIDKLRNANGLRKIKEVEPLIEEKDRPDEPAQLMKEILKQFYASGFPLPYIPKDE